MTSKPDKSPIKGYSSINQPARKTEFIPLPVSSPEIPTLKAREIPTAVGMVHSIEFGPDTPTTALVNIPLNHSPRIRMVFEYHHQNRWHNEVDEQGQFIDAHAAYDTDQELVQHMPERSRHMVVNLPPDAKAYVYYTQIPGQDQKGSDLLTLAFIHNSQDKVSCFRWMVSSQPTV